MVKKLRMSARTMLWSGVFILLCGFIVTASNLLLMIALRINPTLTLAESYVQLTMFDIGYAFVLIAPFLVVRGWVDLGHSNKARQMGSVATCMFKGGVVTLLVGGLLLLNHTVELSARSPLALEATLVLGLYLGILGGFLILVSVSWSRVRGSLRWAALVGAIFVLLFIPSYTGQLHLPTYYGTGLQKPIALVMGGTGITLVAAYAMTHWRSG